MPMFKTKRSKAIASLTIIAFLLPLIHGLLLTFYYEGDHPKQESGSSALLFLLYESPIWISFLLASAMDIQRRRILGSLDKRFVICLFAGLGFSSPLVAFAVSPVPESVPFFLLAATSLSGILVGLAGGALYGKIATSE
jgi:hypothetical protein